MSLSACHVTETGLPVDEAHRGHADLGRHLREKLARHAKAISLELNRQVRLVYQALRNPATPPRAKLALAGAIAYFILPTDALPDFLPALGFTDDAAVIGLALRNLREILRAQRACQGNAEPATPIGQDLRMELVSAREEISHLRREVRKWQRMAKTMGLMTAFLSFLLILVMLGGG
ncbi:MAG: YkvA family protein [Bacteroidota bacterium]